MPSATAPAPSDASSRPASGRHRDAAPAPEPGFGVYVHWPFCLAKCPYCDFNSHVREGIDEGRWLAALRAEIGHYAGLVPGRDATSLFFGGGTPSLMAPATVAVVIDAVAEAWGLTSAAEISLEANPTSVEAGRFAGYRAAGVNRVSLGVQALDDAALAALGRQHGAAEARAAVALAQRLFPRTSFDLIYARPGQSLGAWRAELRQALALAGDHISLYQLTIEPGTPFHQAWRRGDLVALSEEAGAALYEATQELCEAAGLAAYEVSNHAPPGAECRHNLTYWRYGDYVGIGPGAHGRILLDDGRYATRQRRRPEAWLAAVEARGHGSAARVPLDRATQAAEMVMMGLRLSEGLSRAGFRRRLGLDLDEAVRGEALVRLVDGGFLVADERALRVTARGRRVLDAVLAELLP